MSQDGFYGGKQGISPVIKHAFKYVDNKDNAYLAAIAEGVTAAELKPFTMDESFKESTYENVWYGELCIIDTTNKNNPNNGKLFRRTLKGKGDIDLPNRSAEYIGQVVGPASGVPFLSLGSLVDTEDRAHENYVVNDDTEVAYSTDGESIRHDRPADTDNLHVYSTLGKEMLVPGKDGDNFNDTIKYNWFNIRNNTKESPEESWVYLGFEIPFPSLEIDVTNQDWKTDIQIEKTDETDNHPFYHHWKIDIPRGVRGNAASNIRLAQYKDFSNTGIGELLGRKPLYSFSDVEEPIDGREIFAVPSDPEIPEALRVDDLAAVQEVPFFVYDYTFYDKVYGENVSIETYTFFLGFYKEVTNIKLNEDGSVIVSYSNTETVDIAEGNHLTWVTSVTVDSDGIIQFDYNDGHAQNYQLPYPESIQVTDRGLFNVYFKDGTSKQVTLNGTAFDMNYVKQILLNANTKELSYRRYPDGTTVDLDVALNYIEGMIIDDRYHLLAFYGSTLYRPTANDVVAGYKDGSSITITNTTENYNIIEWKGLIFRNGVEYEGIQSDEYWQDFGSVRQINEGIKVTTEINYNNYQYASIVPSYTIEQFIEKVLNPQYWDSEETIENPYWKGRISSILDEDGNDPLRGTFIYTTVVGGGTAYYYDYDAYTWRYAGTWGESSTIDIEIDALPYERVTLSQKGALFKVREEADEATKWTPLW